MTMDKYFTTEIWRMLAVLGIGGFSIMLILGRLITKLRGSFRPYRKTTIIYLLSAAGLAALTGLLAYPGLLGSGFTTYLVFQSLFTLLGIAHLYAMYSLLVWSTGPRTFWLQLLFTLVVAAFAAISFMLVYKWINREGMHLYMAVSLMFFILPLFVYHAFQAAIAIPPKIFKQWYYPVHERVPDPDEGKLKNMLLVAFQFQKTSTAQQYTSFRAKAPADMEFGQLFYYFIQDYNKKHPDGPIEFIDKKGAPYGWIFYKQPKWFTIQTKYIDHEKTFFVNHIREDDVIVCRRTITL